MLYELLITGYVFVCVLLVFLILIQKGKGSAGFGVFGSSSQVLFGGSGGQDIFQKATWTLGALFMLGSFTLSIMKTKQSQSLSYAKTVQQAAPTSQPTSDLKE
ncbi:MAG: preprotein translocase subunit SecG [Candidatus Dependentiae bacterium]|nr:preprotein translocase subunit SecG [Candidatus Dependentiae bacterium]